MNALAATQPIPASWYFDPVITAREEKQLFAQRYVGNARLVPEIGDYHVLPDAEQGHVLVHDTAGLRVLSNVCRHRQAILLQGRGHTKHIACPVHAWAYGLDGQLRGAPHFDEPPRLALETLPTKPWNDLLFSGPRDVTADLGSLERPQDFGLQGFVFEKLMVETYPFNWKTFMELYLEAYHLEAGHPGFRTLCDGPRTGWQNGERFSTQYSPIARSFDRPGSIAHQRYHAAISARGRTHEYGAIWFAYLPNIMIEAYPYARAISCVYPRGPQACLNVVELYIDEEVARHDRGLVEAVTQVYAETASEDAALCLRLEQGRRALWKNQRADFGPLQMPMETGVAHFHDYLRRELGQA